MQRTPVHSGARTRRSNSGREKGTASEAGGLCDRGTWEGGGGGLDGGSAGFDPDKQKMALGFVLIDRLDDVMVTIARHETLE